MSQLVLDSEEISKICKEGSEFVMDAEAEKSLARLLDIQDQIAEFVAKVKDNLVQNALELDQNFTGLKGDMLKVEYRAYGAVYELADLSQVPDDFVTVKTSYTLKTKEVETYEQRNGRLPAGIQRKERNKQLTIKRNK